MTTTPQTEGGPPPPPPASEDSCAISDATLTPGAPAGGVAPPRWGFWGTCAWGVAALAAFYVAQVLAVMGLLLWWSFGHAIDPDEFRRLSSSAVVVGATTLTSLPLTLLVLALAARLARVRLIDYFALYPIGPRTALFAVVCALAYGALMSAIAYALGHPMLSPFVVVLYATARESGMLWLVLLAVVVAAPITEESLFRGFLFRGWAGSRLGVVGAIALTSIIWAAMHAQYDWLGVTEILGLGLLFGWLRYRSGSLLTTLLMHAVYGLAAIIQVAVFTG